MSSSCTQVFPPDDALKALPLVQAWLDMPVYASIGSAALMWSAILLFFWSVPWLSLDFKKNAADRCLSLFHATSTATLASCMEIFTQPQCTTKGSWTRAPMLLLLGWLVVDSISIFVCEFWKKWRPVDMSMVFHHIFIFSFFVAALQVDVGIWFGSTLLINEWSSPFLTFFWYLRYIGQKESNVFIVNGMLLVTAFFAFRIVYIPFNVYQFFGCGFCQDSSNSAYEWAAWVMAIGFIMIYLLNCIWFAKLVGGAWRTLFPKKQDSYRLVND